jgi:Ca2+-binding RTX toxin-like protein
MEKIVGDAGKANAIDGTVTVPSNGTVPVGGTVSFDINLGTNILKLIGLGPTPVPFTVENFVNVIGTSNNDTIVGSEAANDIKGAEGADSIDGGGGADTLWGNQGADTINGGGGADTLWGNEGADRLIGGEGADSLRGGGGTDTFVFSLFSKEVDKVIDFFSIESVVLEGAGFFGFNGEIFTGSRLDSMVGVSQNKGGHVLMVTENGSLLSLEFDGTLFAQLTTDGFNLMT